MAQNFSKLLKRHRRRRYILCRDGKLRLSKHFLQRRYTMPSLSKFSFWSFVLGVVLFVLTSTPLKVISVQEGQEGTYLMLSVLLLLVGALGYITSQEIDHLERSTSEQFDSVWRNFDGVSSDVQKDMDNLSRRIDSFEE